MSSATKLYKVCPQCLVMTEKIYGCNKMTCVNCKCKWCFFCGLRYPNAANKKKKSKQVETCPDTGGHKHKS